MKNHLWIYLSWQQHKSDTKLNLKMKLNYLLLLVLAFIFTSCNGQAEKRNEVYNKDFKWTIEIPQNFENVSPEDWAKIQGKGAKAIENSYGAKMVNRAKTIFVFKSGKLNYLESNYQPFDKTVNGDYVQSCIKVSNIIYKTLETQIPGAKLDTTRTLAKIDDLAFQKFSIKVTYPNKVKLNVLMYSRLFGDKEFSVNIMYVDKKMGEEMLNSWTNSKFGK